MRKCYYFIFILFIISLNGISQNPCCDYSLNGQNPGPGVDSETFGVGLGDIDNDGDLDAVTIDAYDDLEIYLNDSTGTFTYETTYGSDNDWFGVYLVDIDLDNDLDIVASAFYSGEGCDVWKNDGTGSFSLSQGDIASSISTRHIAVVDVTGDGYPDIFAPAYSSGASEVWFNQGNGSFENSSQSLGSSNCTQAAIADFDGDGDLDAYLSKTNGAANTVFLNNGVGYFSDTEQELGSAYTNDCKASDVDGDGDMDVIAANWQTSSRVWLNDGDANFTEGNEIENDNYAKGIAIADIDHDCDDDVIIGSYGSNGLQVWTNDGSGNFTLCFENSNDIYSHGIAVGDMNNDMMPDIWVGNFSGDNGDYIFLKASPVISYDTLSLCEGDSVFLECAWQTEEGDYLDAVNCDTLCWYHVEYTIINTSVTLSNTVLTAEAGYDAYQWFDCETMTNITGADSNVYDPEVSGSYAVEISENGCLDTSNCKYVQTPLAAFTADPTFGLSPLMVSFTDQSIDSVITWHWQFGDGDTSILQHPDHEYANPGMYSVTLKISGPGGNDSLTKQNYIEVLYNPPTADFIGEPTSGPAPLEVQFTDLSADTVNSWEWEFGDGNVSNEQNPMHTYDTSGVYTVSLTVEGPGGSDEMTKTDYITVEEPAPEANFSGEPTSGQAPLTVTFSDLSNGNVDSWKWYFGDGDSSSVQNPVHDYINAGNFTVSLTVEGPGGSDTETKTDYIMIGVGKHENNTGKFLVYPNPVQNKLMVVSPDAEKRKFLIHNINGDVVFDIISTSQKETLDLQNLKPGSYTLTIKNNNNIVSTFKIIKK